MQCIVPTDLKHKKVVVSLVPLSIWVCSTDFPFQMFFSAFSFLTWWFLFWLLRNKFQIRHEAASVFIQRNNFVVNFVQMQKLSFTPLCSRGTALNYICIWCIESNLENAGIANNKVHKLLVLNKSVVTTFSQVPYPTSMVGTCTSRYICIFLYVNCGKKYLCSCNLMVLQDWNMLKYRNHNFKNLKLASENMTF